MLPRLISCRQWHVWKPLPGLFASSLSLLAPPSRGVLISLTIGFVIAVDSQEDDYYVHEGPLRADLRGL